MRMLKKKLCLIFVLHILHKPKSERMMSWRETSRLLLAALPSGWDSGWLKKNPSVDFLPLMCLITVDLEVSYSCYYLTYFSGKTEYQTTKTNKARRSTSFERRPSKRYSRRTLQMQGECSPVSKDCSFLSLYHVVGTGIVYLRGCCLTLKFVRVN